MDDILVLSFHMTNHKSHWDAVSYCVDRLNCSVAWAEIQPCLDSGQYNLIKNKI